MRRDHEQIISTLNALVETCKDGQQGYRLAAGHVQRKELKRLFRSYASQRADFAAELQAEVRHLGGAPEKGGTVLGALHRGWFNLKSTLVGETEAAVLAECERREELAMKQYEAAASENLPLDLQGLLARQYKEIKDARRRLHDLQQPPAPARAKGRTAGPAPATDRPPRTSARRSPRTGESSAASTAPTTKAPAAQVPPSSRSGTGRSATPPRPPAGRRSP
jgi:uncharacterized protein (TIGR02284 family)